MKIGEIVNFQNGYAFKSKDFKNDGKYKIIKIKELKEGKVKFFDDSASVDIDDEKKFEKYIVRNGDILFALTGDPVNKNNPLSWVGRVSIYESNQLALLNQRVAKLIPTDKINSKYIYYYFRDFDNFYRLASIAKGSASQANISTKDIKAVEIELPDINIQDKVVLILDCIEEKININNKINNNLEEQARALFRNFVDNSSKTDKISIEDIVLTANTGADAIRKAPIVDHDTGIRCVRVGDMSNKRSFHDWGYAKVTKEVFDRYQLRKNDIIVTRTASLGLNMIVPDDLQAVYNNGLIRLSIDSKKALPLFIYRQIQTQDFSNYIARIESETSVRPNMKINYLLKYNFDLPSLEEQYNLINLLQPMIESQTTLITENNGLNKLRDTLLPKLMSGEIDVSNISI